MLEVKLRLSQDQESWPQNHMRPSHNKHNLHCDPSIHFGSNNLKQIWPQFLATQTKSWDFLRVIVLSVMQKCYIKHV